MAATPSAFRLTDEVLDALGGGPGIREALIEVAKSGTLPKGIVGWPGEKRRVSTRLPEDADEVITRLCTEAGVDKTALVEHLAAKRLGRL